MTPELESSPVFSKKNDVIHLDLSCNKNGTTRMLSAVPIVSELQTGGDEVSIRIVQGAVNPVKSDCQVLNPLTNSLLLDNLVAGGNIRWFVTPRDSAENHI
jgi:N-acetylglucosamine kinase-like BadF-type ATPase